jgi:hypothetical protein
VRARPGAGGPEKVDEVLEAGGRFLYSGKVALGAQRLAVVNDSEYRTGELVGENRVHPAGHPPRVRGAPGPQSADGCAGERGRAIEEDIIKFVEEGDAKQ